MKCESGKLSFDTQHLGWLKVIELEKRKTHVGNVYKCNECQSWHMTTWDDKRPDWVECEIIKHRNHKLLMGRQKKLANIKKGRNESKKAKERKLTRNNPQKIAMVADMNKNIKRSWWRNLKMKFI